MSTIQAILDADADGSVHLPLPAELRQGKVMVIATPDQNGRAGVRDSRC